MSVSTLLIRYKGEGDVRYSDEMASPPNLGSFEKSMNA